MFTSSADVFRTRQAVHDLLEVVHLHRDAVKRIGASGADNAAIEAIIQNGARIPGDKPRSYSSILLAAAMPDEDFNGFIAATAILLADRLQNAGGQDDLYWNYEAFRDHYCLADAPARAAIMNGFRAAHQSGRCKLPDAPDEKACLTRRKDDVLLLLKGEGLADLERAIEADVMPDVAGRLWTGAVSQALSLPELAGYRYLYERQQSMAPVNPDRVDLIPWT